MKKMVTIALAAGASAMAAGSATAGGFSRGTADTDILYEQGDVNARAGVTWVNPNRKFRTNSNPALVGTTYSKAYVIPSFAAKFGNDRIACAATYTEVYGAASDYDYATSPALVSPIRKNSETIGIDEYGATCAVFVPMERGRLAFLGGVFVEKLDYRLDGLLPTPLGSFPVKVSLSGSDVGWRAGVGYEIPEIALRAELMYRSATEHNPDGTITGAGILVGQPPAAVLPAFGVGDLPQSVELKLQSGIAPGWLAFGSIKWTDWSVNETLDLGFSGRTANNQYYWKDGWTVTAGVGHAFNEQVAGSVALRWDRGVSTGYDLYGDTYTLALGTSVKDSVGGELRAGVGISYQEGPVAHLHPAGSESMEDGWAYSGQLGYKFRW
ncbi:outer membrane protein transport protein [Limoniibacter endophyticus]|uniref:Long-chain fatty acid transporter n=1 Tax=Limoniibacter endophyticus TaxID=1565040 RepID=A0A8J3GGY6_9HYPH|nr:outer membrane protein transport protein [Limoniibacter endophyticus]GHC63035.1 long-chain fatty acid transporter [Limoniibacter endophyticus]